MLSPFRLQDGTIVRRWAYENIREVLRRRYLLQAVAIEVFSVDGRNVMLVFDKEDCEHVANDLRNRAGKMKSHNLNDA